jgi:hypothetical protein
MLRNWTDNWSTIYLRELYRHHSPPESVPCSCGSGLGSQYSCDDCFGLSRFCQSCLVSLHQHTPCHRVSVWTGSAWSRTSLSEVGLVLALGDHLTPCPKGNPRPFVIGDLSGFHRINVTFCECAHGAEWAVQLLRAHILPCSEQKPSTGFTFSMLRLFHLASTDAKLSASRFYALLQRSTNNMMPHLHQNRFREFLRASRQWMHLQDLKRAGVERSTSAESQSLALRCPACPRLNVNYSADDMAPGKE